MKVLITGGAGFIGSHLVDSLLEEVHHVIVLDDLSSGALDNIRQHQENNAFQFIHGDVRDEADVALAIDGCQLVFHLAAVVGVKRIVEDPLSGLLTNLRGTEVVLEAAEREGAKLILASSSEAYGKSTKIPFRENDDLVFGPSFISRWSYAAAKVSDEHLALAYASRGVEVAILRYFNCYGPRLDPEGYGSVVGRFIGQALKGEPITVHGDGEQTRSFTYVSDTVKGTLLAGLDPSANGEIINIGTDRESTILELAQMVIRLTNSKSTINLVPYETVYGPDFEDPRRRQPSVERARNLLGFEARVSLEEGLRRTMAYFKKKS
jgi:UDP-glucose 4-epimerase